jgi:hypothetical protein
MVEEFIVTNLDLHTPYPLTNSDVEHFRNNGFVRLKRALSNDVLSLYGEEITRKVIELNTLHLPMEQRSTYQRAFLQIMNLWTKSDVVREFVFGKRLARIAAELLGVQSVRMYHDQALYKEAGGGFTPWHADQFYWPIDTDKCCTVWIPLQETTADMGPLAFAAGSHNFTFGRDLPISDDSEAMIEAALAKQKYPYISDPFELGEVSFHYGWTFHRADANNTNRARRVMTIIYMDANMRLKTPQNANQQQDWESWCPGVWIGEVINSPLNPIIYDRDIDH